MNTKSRRILMPALVMLAPALALAAETLDVKPGLWETTTVTTSTGLSIPAEALARVPEAQRGQMQEMLKQMGAGAPSTRTDRSCVTEEDLKEGVFKALREAENANCTHTIVKATARQQEIEMNCTGTVPAKGHMRLEAINSETVKGEMDVKSTAVTMNMKFDARRLSATCPAEAK